MKTKYIWYIAGGLLIILLIFKGKKMYNSISDFANSLIGNEELPNNSGFKNSQFAQLMKEAGWQKGNSWCVFFAKAVWLKTLKGKALELAKKYVVANSQDTYTNFKNLNSPLFSVSKFPKVGGMVIFQHFDKGIGTHSGHAGIITEVTKDYFKTIEGNTNNDGSREGTTVLAKTRKYNFDSPLTGLRLKGFININ